MTQWLRLLLPMQGALVQPLVRDLRPHMLFGVAKKKKKKFKINMNERKPLHSSSLESVR